MKIKLTIEGYGNLNRNHYVIDSRELVPIELLIPVLLKNRIMPFISSKKIYVVDYDAKEERVILSFSN